MHNHTLTQTTKLGHDMLSGLVPLTESQQRLALYAISMYQRGECDGHRVTMRVQDIHHIVGGEKNRIYRTLRDNAKHLKNAQIIDGPIDPSTGNTIISSYFSEIELRPGQGEFIATLSSNLINLISEIKTKYILIHLANIRKLRGSTVISLYMVFAQWDSMGSLSITSKDLSGRLQLSDSMAVVSRLSPKIVTPALAKIKKGIGVDISISTEGRGINATITFTWPPNALRSAAGDQPELPGMSNNLNEETLVRAGLEARLRGAGVLDKSIFSIWLHRLSINETAAIVESALRDGLKNHSLRDRIVARVSERELEANRHQSIESARKVAEAGESRPSQVAVNKLASQAAPGGPHHEAWQNWIDEQGAFSKEGAAKDPEAWRRWWAEEMLRSPQADSLDPVEATAEHIEDPPPPPVDPLAKIPDNLIEAMSFRGSIQGIPKGSSAAYIRQVAKGDPLLGRILATTIALLRDDLLAPPPLFPPTPRDDVLAIDIPKTMIRKTSPVKRGRPKKVQSP